MDVPPYYRCVLPREAHTDAARQHANAPSLAAGTLSLLALRVTSWREHEGEPAGCEREGGFEQVVVRKA